jgi:PAS domain S-box-containing protein
MSSTVLGRLLVVDDEFQLMDALVEALNAQGYAAQGFITGIEAIQALQKQEFDLLLCDLMMPGMDGITLLKACMALDPNLMGIVMTGQGTVPTAVEAMKTGAFDYVLKPFRLDELLPVLARAREVQRLRLENIQLRETVAIYNLSQTIALSLDSRLVLENTADAALQQLDADEVSIMLLRPENQELYIAAVRGRNREHLLGQSRSLQEGIAGWVANHLEPLILNDSVSDVRFAPIEPRPGIKSAISMPMLAAGKLIGVLNINKLHPRRAFTPGQVKALSILTSTAAAALENEALYRALETREKHFRALLENSSDTVTLLNPEGRISYSGPSARQVLGYEPYELVSQSVFDLVHPDDRETMLAGFMETLQQPRQVGTTQLRVRHKDGSWHWIEGTSQNLLDEPSVQAVVVNYRDITQRKLAEEAVRKSERQMRSLVTSLDDIVFEFDKQGTYLNVWSADESLLFRPKDELLGKQIMEVLGEENGRPFAEAVKRVISSGNPESIEYSLAVLGGQRWFVARTSPILDADGSFRTAAMLIRDITARKQAERTIADTNDLLSRAEQIGHIGSWARDVVQDQVVWSDGLYRIYGLTPQEFDATYEAYLDRVHPDDRDDVRRAIETAYRERAFFEFENRIVRSDGEIRIVYSRGDVLLDDQGEPASLLGIGVDITERKQAEEALRQSRDFAEKVIQTANVIFLQLDTAGNVLKLNTAAEEISGYNLAEIEGRNWFGTLVPKNRYPEVWEEFIRIVQSGEPPKIFENIILTKQGKERYILWKNNVLREGEHIVGTISFGMDVTERRQAEKTLREKERLLSEAQSIGHIGSWSYDILTDTLLYSDEMYRLFDVPPREFQHNRQGFLDLIYLPDFPVVANWMDDIRVDRPTGELEFRIFRGNGELRYIRCRGAIQSDANHKPKNFVGTAQDVTERRLAEIQIRQQIERLNALREIDQAIISSTNLQVTLGTILSQVISQLQVDAADVLLIDPQKKVLQYVTGKGFRTHAVETALVPMEDSHPGQAVTKLRLIHIEDLKNSPDARLLTSLGMTEEFVCYLGVPVFAKGKVKGVLEVFHRVPLHPYSEWLDFLNTLAGQAAIAIEDATLYKNLEQSNRELFQAYEATIEGWSHALDLRDKETEGHTQRVTEMTLKLARAIGLPEDELLHIRRGALLHDIGKMGVPDHILLKPGGLTEEEWTLMKSHPQYAYDLLKPIAFLGPALDIPYCHHEKWDGTGYPRRLKGQEIPLVGRLFAVVDVWDAITSDRPYRPAWSEQDARIYIREQSGKHFDPQVVDAFLKMIG